MNDLLSVRLDLEKRTDRVTQWMITRQNDVPRGWTIVTTHGDYCGLIQSTDDRMALARLKPKVSLAGEKG